MKKRYLFLMLSFFAAITFTSCFHEPKGVTFDEKEFEENKEKWISSGVDAYSFEYSFNAYMPDWITGSATVNGQEKSATAFCNEGCEEVLAGVQISSNNIYYLSTLSFSTDNFNLN